MSALWLRFRNGPLYTLDRWWWHHGPGHETRARLDVIETDHALMDQRVTGLIKAMRLALDAAGVPIPEPADHEPEPEQPAPLTQRDVDDAVAALIEQARQDFGRGGAR